MVLPDGNSTQTDLAASNFEHFTGTYRLDFEPVATAVIEINDEQINLTSPDGETIPIEPRTKWMFKGNSPQYGPLTIIFVEGADRQVDRLVTFGSFSSYTFLKD